MLAITSPLLPLLQLFFFISFILKQSATPTALMKNLISHLIIENNPYLQNLPQFTPELKSFSDKALVVEGDVF